MKYSESEIRQYVAEEDVKFLRMTFFDLTGNQKNMSILRYPRLRRRAALGSLFAAGHFDALSAPVAAGSRACGAPVLPHSALGRHAL